MDQSPSCKANGHSTGQEILPLLWNHKGNYRVHNSPTLVPILVQIYPVHTFPPYFRKIHFNSYLTIYT
jgi:hypothetical protein